jgi:hypothetical protein
MHSESNIFFVVLARNASRVFGKIEELENLQVKYIVICGEKFNHPRVVERKPLGKWDAINFAAQFVPSSSEIVALNDVDTKIHNLNVTNISLHEYDLIYCDVRVESGPQTKFYKLLNPLRKKFNIAASGELMFISRLLFTQVLPIPPCIAEDSYILFKALELGHRVRFDPQTFVTTQRTLNAEMERSYKRRTTLGIYQALRYTKPPPAVITFYYLLPFFAPLLACAGENGRAWVRGIMEGFTGSISGDGPHRF